MKLSTVEKLSVALFATQAAIALGVELKGPVGAIPTHFDLQGQANGWSDRIGLAVTIGGLAVIGALMVGGLGLAIRQVNADDAGRRRGLAAAQAVVSFAFPAVAALILALSLGGLETMNNGPVALMVGLSLLMAGAGAVMGRVGPNPFVGVRTPWAYKSRLAWDRSNRLIGRLWFIGGLVGLAATAFVSQPTGMQMLLAWMVGSALIAVVESWRVWRNDPDRQPF